MKTVLILGAGITRASRPRSPLKTRPPLDADFFSVAHAASLDATSEVLESLESLVGDYVETLRGSLEMATTYLYLKALDAKKGSSYHEGFLRLLNLINFVLARTTNPLKTGPRSLIYRFLRSELVHVDSPEDLTIITFNYDLLLERVLEELANHRNDEPFWFPGCYRLEDVERIQNVANMPVFDTEEYAHEGVALLKLHGSMNWQSNHTSNTPTSHALFNPSRPIHILDSPLISESLSWRRNRRMVYMKPVIVPPISGKRGMMHSRLLGVWKTAARALSEADRVVIAGYSCPPLDLEARILLSESMRSNQSKRVYVIDPNATSASRFIELCGVDHITMYTSISDWVRDARPRVQSNNEMQATQ